MKKEHRVGIFMLFCMVIIAMPTPSSNPQRVMAAIALLLGWLFLLRDWEEKP